jgi:hypothetical protein
LTNFEFVFSLLVILLGLALAAVLGGVARVMKTRPRVRIGWATGFLAAWVTTETIIFWQVFWRTRGALPPSAAVLFTGFIITALYYFAAASVFPDKLEDVASLDEYFMQEKAKVIAAVLLALPLSLALWAAVLGRRAYDVFTWLDWTSFAIMYVAGPIAMLTKRRKVATVCLGLLVVVDLLDPVASVLLPK